VYKNANRCTEKSHNAVNNYDTDRNTYFDILAKEAVIRSRIERGIFAGTGVLVLERGNASSLPVLKVKS
jgi:hypothetical protein